MHHSLLSSDPGGYLRFSVNVERKRREARWFASTLTREEKKLDVVVDVNAAFAEKDPVFSVLPIIVLALSRKLLRAV